MNEVENLLIELLKGSTTARVTCAGRWMVVEGDDKVTTFIVLHRPYRAKNTLVLYEGDSLKTAIRYLSGEWS